MCSSNNCMKNSSADIIMCCKHSLQVLTHVLWLLFSVCLLQTITDGTLSQDISEEIWCLASWKCLPRANLISTTNTLTDFFMKFIEPIFMTGTQTYSGIFVSKHSVHHKKMFWKNVEISACPNCTFTSLFCIKSKVSCIYYMLSEFIWCWAAELHPIKER